VHVLFSSRFGSSVAFGQEIRQFKTSRAKLSGVVNDRYVMTREAVNRRSFHQALHSRLGKTATAETT